MLELATEVAMPTQVELLLTDLLDREWVDQSGRAAPLQPTAAVRELLELVLAPARWGIDGELYVDWLAATPDELVASLRDVLPAELSPWRSRMARRSAALRAAPLQLSAPVEQPQLPPGTPTDALPEAAAGAPSQPQPDRPPAPRRKPSPEPMPAAPAPFPAADPARSRRRLPELRFAVLAVCCIVLGAAIGSLDGGLAATDFALGAAAGFAAASSGGAQPGALMTATGKRRVEAETS